MLDARTLSVRRLLANLLHRARISAPSSLLFFALHMKGMRNEILRRRVKARQLKEVDRASRDPAMTSSGAV